MTNLNLNSFNLIFEKFEITTQLQNRKIKRILLLNDLILPQETGDFTTESSEKHSRTHTN